VQVRPEPEFTRVWRVIRGVFAQSYPQILWTVLKTLRA
jgi:hypothetical protein